MFIKIRGDRLRFAPVFVVFFASKDAKKCFFE